jgi:hypothetical protein
MNWGSCELIVDRDGKWGKRKEYGHGIDNLLTIQEKYISNIKITFTKNKLKIYVKKCILFC